MSAICALFCQTNVASMSRQSRKTCIIVILVLINEKNVETHIVSKPGGLNPRQGLDIGVASPEALKHFDDFSFKRIVE